MYNNEKLKFFGVDFPPLLKIARPLSPIHADEKDPFLPTVQNSPSYAHPTKPHSCSPHRAPFMLTLKSPILKIEHAYIRPPKLIR